MKIAQKKLTNAAAFYLRLTLGFTLLSALADRFGLWGGPETAGVAWGNWKNFVAYTHQLNAFAGNWTAEVLAIVATLCELVLGIALILGYKTRWAALATGILTLLFALAMTIALGVKAPLDYSVFVDSGAGLLLAGIPEYKWSIDEKLSI